MSDTADDIGTIEARERAIYQALNVVNSRMHSDLNPGDPHGSDSVDYAKDEFDRSVRELAARLGHE